MNTRRVIVVVVAVLMLAGGVLSQAPRIADVLHKDVELTRRELPGATVLFPTGKALQEKIAYEDGRLEIQFGAAGRATLIWTTGEPLADSEFEAVVVTPMKEALGLTIAERGPVQVAGNPGKRWLLSGKRLDMVVSDWACGKRSFNLVVGSRDDVAALEQRIRTSFECRPDPALDGKASTIGVDVDLGPDFGLDSENPLVLVSLEAEAVVVSVYTGRESPAEAKFDEIMPKFMDGVATSMGVTGTSFETKTVERGPTGARKVWYSQGVLEGEPRRLLSTSLVCGAEKYIALYMGDAARPESRGLDLLLGARCAKAPKRPPPFAEVARKACARGDKRGCATQN